MVRFNLPKQFDGVSVFSSEALDGSMSLNSPDWQQSATEFLKRIGAKDPLVYVNQPHQDKIIVVHEESINQNADGIITQKNFTLGIRTADCLPVMIFDRRSGLIGAIHVGRRGLLKGILEKSLGQLLAQESISPKNIAVFIGPHIRVKNYDISLNVQKEIGQTKFKKYIISSGEKVYFDLTAAAINSLEEIGIKAENIVDSKINTFTSKEFFSVRSSQDYQNIQTFLTVIFKNEDPN